jgi:hypothetical protein
MKSFKHSGDLGDIIYSLPTIKDLGGGILYLDLTNGKSDEYCIKQGYTKFNKHSYDFIYPLLKNQNYINDIKIYENQSIDINLNKMRSYFVGEKSRTNYNCLVDLHRQSFNLDFYDVNIPWISCGDPIKFDKKIIISRSPRYQSNWAFFAGQKDFFSKNAIFIGLKKEHEYFEWAVETKIDFIEVDNALTMAKIIYGSDIFIGNPTFSLSLAVGLPCKKIIQEFDKNCPTTYFPTKTNMIRV